MCSVVYLIKPNEKYVLHVGKYKINPLRLGKKLLILPVYAKCSRGATVFYVLQYKY